MSGVSAVWVRHGGHFQLAGRVRRDRMSKPERAWFAAKAQTLLDTTAAPYGADVISTLVDDTTYSRDLQGQVRSVDIVPTVLHAMGIAAGQRLPQAGTPNCPVTRVGTGVLSG
jgi:hypothetical protein